MKPPPGVSQHPSAPPVPGYVLSRPLGRGDRAEVWKAWQERTGKEVALKVLRGLGEVRRAALRASLERLIRLDRHPHVLAVLDADLSAEPAWYAMDLLESGSLAARAAAGPPASAEEAARWLEEGARALSYIHGRGLLHGNLKPSNVLLDDEGRVRVADVGGGAEAEVSGDCAALAAAVRAAAGGVPFDEDLEAVLEKCGSRDGYGSMTGLLADLEARRARLPVSALAHDRVYRARRFMRRNAAVLALLSLLAGALGWGGWQVASKNAALSAELAGAYSLRARAAALQGDPAAAALLFAKSNALRPSDAARRDALAYAADLERPLATWRLKGPAHSAALSDGRLLAAADGGSALVETATGKVLAEPGGSDPRMARALGAGSGAAFSADGTRFLLDTPYGHAVLGDALDGAELERLQGSMAAFSPDGSLIAASDWSGSVVLTDWHGSPPSVTEHGGSVVLYHGRTGFPTGVRIRHHRGKGADAAWVAFRPDGKALLTCIDETIELWDPGTGRRLGPPIRYDSEVGLLVSPMERAVFSPDGRRILSYTWGRAVVLDPATGRVVGKLMRHEGRITAAAWADGGNRVVTAGEDGRLRLWSGGEEPGVPDPDSMRHAGAVEALAVSPDGALVASAGADGTARLWSLDPWGPYSGAMVHGAGVTGVAFSPDGRTLVTTARDGTARSWAVPEAPRGRRSVRSLSSDVHIGPRGERLLAYDYTEGASLRRVADGAVLAKDLGGGLGTGPYERVSFDAAERRVLFARKDQAEAWIWDLETAKPLAGPLSHGQAPDSFGDKGRVTAADLSRDGERAVTAGVDGRVVVWDARTGKALAEWARQAFFADAAFSPAADRVAVAKHEETEVLPVGGGEPLTIPHGGAFARWSPDGARLLTVDGEARSVLVSDAKSGKPAGPALVFGERVMFAAFSPDGRRAAAGGWDGTARLIDPDSGLTVGPPLRHEGKVWCAAFSPDGRVLATGGEDGTIRFWDAATGEPAGRPLWQGRLVSALSFSPDGRALHSAGNWQVQTWDLGWLTEAATPQGLLGRAEALSQRRLDAKGLPAPLPPTP